MLDDIIEVVVEFILEITIGDKLDRKWEEIRDYLKTSTHPISGSFSAVL